MNRRRLEMLVEMLENHEKHFPNLEFNMGVWHCGSAACALGSAACYPPFVEEGLYIYEAESFEAVPAIQGYEDLYVAHHAAAYFFDISAEKSRDFFYEGRYSERSVTPGMVAERIRKFLDESKAM